MGCAEAVVFTFRAPDKARQAVFLAQRPNAVAPFGQDFVRVRLVPHVPDQTVIRRVEHAMQRHRQLDDAQTSTQVTTRAAHCINQLSAQFFGHLWHLRRIQSAQVVRAVDFVEQGRDRA